MRCPSVFSSSPSRHVHRSGTSGGEHGDRRAAARPPVRRREVHCCSRPSRSTGRPRRSAARACARSGRPAPARAGRPAARRTSAGLSHVAGRSSGRRPARAGPRRGARRGSPTRARDGHRRASSRATSASNSVLPATPESSEERHRRRTASRRARRIPGSASPSARRRSDAAGALRARDRAAPAKNTPHAAPREERGSCWYSRRDRHLDWRPRSAGTATPTRSAPVPRSIRSGGPPTRRAMSGQGRFIPWPSSRCGRRSAKRVRVLVDDREHDMTDGPRRLVAGRRPGRGARAPPTRSCSTTTRPRCPTRARGGSPPACTARRGSTTTTPSSGPTTPGPAASCPGSVLYELHIGTFTAGGTFDVGDRAARPPRRRSGVDLVEVLPVNAVDGPRTGATTASAGTRCTENYGGPDAFKRFVDACHARGLGVVLDVVYNHLGPSGAYLDRFGPYFAGRRHLGSRRSTWTARTPSRCAAT